MVIRFFDMFAGIGGFRSGLEAVGGFQCIGHCEIDKEAQVLYALILSEHASESDFVSKLVGCFNADQTDEQLIESVNSAFGTELTAEDFGKVMGGIRAVYIDTSGYTDPTTKNNLDLVQWAIEAEKSGWGYVWGTYGDVFDQEMFDFKLQESKRTARQRQR